MNLTPITTAATASLLFCQIGISWAGQEFPIAGLDPAERPAEAPVIQGVMHPPAWYAHALTGISRPIPASLRFLEDQGNWYTPFNEPGMTGRYDLRGWHRARSYR